MRLDAYFRQVGLDGHFGKLDDAKKDIAQMRTDWNATKDAVGAVVHGMIVELDYDRRSLPSSQRSSMFAQDCDRRSDAS